MPIWRCEERIHLVAGAATVLWLDLCSPFGDCPAGVDWTIELPEGLTVLDSTRRPHFGSGPDAHRPHVRRDGRRLELSFTGMLPEENQRRPMTDPVAWCELHYPLVVIAEGRADGGELTISRRAVGDNDERRLSLSVAGDPGSPPAHGHRRCMQVLYWPWFSPEEQESLALTLGRCGITDVALNWHGTGLPLLPPAAYALSARTLRQAIPGVKIWLGGLPGADTLLPRAQSSYGQAIPFVASPEAALAMGPDLVVVAERSWCEAVQPDGVMIALSEPSAVDTEAMPAHCFSPASRRRFATDLGLAAVPDPHEILRRHREAWVDFCCRQVRRLIEVARRGHGGRPLAICAYGPEGPARAEASADWQQLGTIADVLVYSHLSPAPGITVTTSGRFRAVAEQPRAVDGAGAQPQTGSFSRSRVAESVKRHWGYTRVAGLPQSWWERGHDPLGVIDPELAVADAKMQLALSGGAGVRIGSWAALDGRLQRVLMAWR